jgi:DNA-directed RNA polymerase subunit RPC12/RpoP
MKQQALSAGLGIRVPPPIMCPGCGARMLVTSYFITRPERAECVELLGGCGTIWEDHDPHEPRCPACGYSTREHGKGGLGCMEA